MKAENTLSQVLSYIVHIPTLACDGRSVRSISVERCSEIEYKRRIMPQFPPDLSNEKMHKMISSLDSLVADRKRQQNRNIFSGFYI